MLKKKIGKKKSELMLGATANTRLLKKAVRASNAFLSETRVRVSEA